MNAMKNSSPQRAPRKGRPKTTPALWLLAVTALLFATGCKVDFAAFHWMEWLVAMINFGIFSWVIIKFGGPHIQQFFADRREDFLRNMKAATNAREEAEAVLEEYEAKLDALEKERQALLDEYHAQGEREKQQIVDAAKRQVEKMRADAEATIAQEVKKAVSVLEQQAVDLAIDMARDKAREKLDGDRQEKLFDRYVDQLDESDAA